MSNLRTILCRVVLFLLIVAISPTIAVADWTAYAVGHIGISTGSGDVSGTFSTQTVSGSDRDSSPMMAIAGGIDIPMNELMAWKLPYDLELPDWPVRVEFEFAGLRDFEYRTVFNNGLNDDIVLSSNKSWAMMVNSWFDMPATVLTRPTAWMFQTRKSSARRILDPITFYAGVGIGTARLKLDAITSANEQARSDDFKFAWQVGTGLGYKLTPFVNVDLGYRFFKARDLEPTLLDSNGQPAPGDYNLKERIHEFRAGLRVNVYSFTSPWSRLE